MHQHKHQETQSSQRIAWAFFLNLIFTIIEFIGGWLTNSTAIMADAVHDLGDCLSIGTAWGLNKLSGKEANETYTFGYRRFSLLGALINSLVLIIGSVWVLSAALPRLRNPEMPMADGMLVLAIFGIAVNGFAAYKLSAGKTLNERVLNWHLLEDVLGWVAVLIVSIVLMFFDWPILDPILSIAFTLFILVNVLKNLVATTRLFLQAAPNSTLQLEIKNKLLENATVHDVHHLHYWSLDGEQNVLTAHLVLNRLIEITEQVKLKQEIMQKLKPFQIAHSTIEFEFPDELCRNSGFSEHQNPH